MDDTLAFEDDDDASQTFGQLSISDEQDNSDIQKDNRSAENGNSSYKFDKLLRSSPAAIVYEVIHASINKDGRSKYVVYTLLMKHFPSDPAACTLHKRYSDFVEFLAQLKKIHPKITSNLTLPPKQLTGNFKAKTIAERSRSFEQLLAHVSQVKELRYSDPVLSFIYGEPLRVSVTALLQDNYKDAQAFLLKVLSLQRKLMGDIAPQTAYTMAALAHCCYVLGNATQSEVFAKTAVNCMTDDDKLLVPTLTFSIRLCWTLGTNKQGLEQKLQNLKEKGVHLEGQRTLAELITEWCQAILAQHGK